MVMVTCSSIGPAATLRTILTPTASLIERPGKKSSVVSTVVDHGTAFDIAGKNQADARSMKEAMRVAARMAWTRSLASKFSS